MLATRNTNGNTSYLKDWGVVSEHGVLTDVLLGPIDNFRWLKTSSITRRTLRRQYKFDLQIAQRQHRELIDAYQQAGVKVHLLKADENLPMQVFSRDSSVMTPFGAVITQMAQWWRRGEYAAAINFYSDNNIPIYDMISAGSCEGGDIAFIEEGLMLIGYSGIRTQKQAAKQFSSWLEKEGWEVKLADIDEFYVHMDMMFSMLAEKLAVVCVDAMEQELLGWLKEKKIKIIPVSFADSMKSGCNLMSVGNDTIITSASSRDLNDKLKAMGFRILDPDISMIEKGGGSVRCLAQPLKREKI